MSSIKSKGLIAGIATLLIFIVLIVVLYLLGDSDQSALERLRDIAIIFIVLTSAITVVLLAGITVALIFLTIQIKERVIPLLEETTGTVKRLRGTTNFVTEEAIRPILNVAGSYSKLRGMTKTVTGKRKKPPKI
jgi:hypothetical protein